MSLRGRSAAVAILKPKVWHPVAKHGALARRISNILEIKVVGFIAKPTIFVSLRGAQRRGNLKAEGMASRSEAREQKTTESPNFGSSRSDTTAALLRKRHFTRANACISRAQYLSHDQRSYFTAQPCRASFRDAVSFRQRLPRRAQKMRPPRNDKFDRVCWKTKRFSERNA